jgi:nucleotide-binding universal stress UspA family protein
LLRVARRWFVALGAEPKVRSGADEQTARSPIVLAAIDVANAEPALLEALCISVERVMQTQPGARLACLAVMKTNLIALDELVEADGSSKHVNLLVQLKHWARPVVQSLALKKDEQDARVTFHVLEAPDPAAAIVDYARRNQIDQIVMGARSSSAWRRYLGSVSAQVVAEAPCSVTVVRVPGTN